MYFKRVTVIFLIAILFFPNVLLAKKTKPLIWDLDNLEQMKRELPNSLEAKIILGEADMYCTLTPLDVVHDKVLTYPPDTHYYCSMGPYSWPDPDNLGYYVTKDGLTNPDFNSYDSGKLYEVSRRFMKLSQAFFLTDDIKYYNTFLEQVKVWFLNEETLMYPNLEYAQLIPNHNNNKGTSTGMIDGYFFNTIIESVRLLDYSKRIDIAIMKGLQKWFLAFANWAEDRYGDAMKEGNTNINLAYDVTIVNMYIFAGKPNKANVIINNFAERRINTQILEDGRQPEELKRTRAYSYSLYNLTHILDFCFLAKVWDKDYYKKHGGRIEKAFSFLEQYADDPNSFPYKQITSWDDDLGGLKIQQKRLERLKSR